MGTTATAPLSAAPLSPTFRTGDLIAVTGAHDGYYGRVGTLVGLREEDGKWVVRLVNGPLLVLPVEHIADAAEFWSRDENVVDVAVCRGAMIRL